MGQVLGWSRIEDAAVENILDSEADIGWCMYEEDFIDQRTLDLYETYDVKECWQEC